MERTSLRHAKSTINDELAVFAASGGSVDEQGACEIQQQVVSNADMLALNAAKLQNTLALFNDAKEKDKRNAEIDVVAKTDSFKNHFAAIIVYEICFTIITGVEI